MMKLILSLTLIWALSSTAGALVCQSCTNALCSSQTAVTCNASETMCVTAAIQATLSGVTVTQIFRGCASSALCPVTGSQTFSVNLGASSAVAAAQCCNTDNCNTATLAAPATPANNSLQCFTCTGRLCNTQTQCRGNEDRCFQASVTVSGITSSTFGCASSNLCAAAQGLGNLPFLGSVGAFTSGPTCCGTSLCNTNTTTTTTPLTTTTTAAPTTTASDAFCIRLGMIHLLLGLLIFTLC